MTFFCPYLFNVCEPVSPFGFGLIVILHSLNDLRKVELRSVPENSKMNENSPKIETMQILNVPTTDSVVGAKVSLDLKAKSRRGIPLKSQIEK